MKNANKLLFLDKHNFPIEKIKGRYIQNFLRIVIHTRRIMKYKTWVAYGGCEINFN